MTRLIQRQRDYVTIEQEPCFKVGAGTYMPVSREIPEVQREIIIREMKAVNLADAVGNVMVFAFAGLCMVLLACVLVGFGFLLHTVAT